MGYYQSPERVSTYAESLKADVVGELDPSGLALFRGIPYATLDKRWTQSTPLHQLQSPFTAVEFGPRCPQGNGMVLVSGGVVDPTPGDNEFTCLNLNVTVPQQNLNSGQLLPVMVWIHGGAFNYGANSVARYRPQALCAYAQSIGKPIVLVQVNYRLGPLGFAISNDLVAEQEHSAPYLGNFGLVDQQNALQWVQQHIRDFGGDPGRVTAFGVSAGSASIHYHILSGQPLFDRAIMMSGSAGTMGPLPFDLYEGAWQELCLAHKVTDLSVTDRLAALRALSADELIETYTSKAMGSYGDGKLIPSTYDYTDIERESRCKTVILGDTRVEGIIFDSLSHKISQTELGSLLRELMPDAQTYDEFCSAFGFTNGSFLLDQKNMPYEAYRDALRLVLAVGTFQFPTLRVAETFASKDSARKAYLYHFEENSPYPGPTFGLSYHGLCALFLHLNQLVEPDFPDLAATTSKDMAAAWAAFAYGEEPWPLFDPRQGKNKFMRWGPHGQHRMMAREEDDTRPYGYLPWVREHWQIIQKLTRRLLHEG